MAKVIPGPSGRYFIGNLGQIDGERLHQTIYNFKQEFGNIFEFWMFSQRVIVISDVSLMEKAFSRQELCHRPDDFLKHIKYDGSGYLDSNFSDKDLALKSIVWKALSTIRDDHVLKGLRQAELDRFIASLDNPDGVDVVETIMKSTSKQYATVLSGLEAIDEHVVAMNAFLDAVRNCYAGGKLVLLGKFPWLRYFPGPFKRVDNLLLRSRVMMAESIVSDAREHRRKSHEHGILQHMMAANDQTDTNAVRTITDENLIASSMDIVFNAVTPGALFTAFAILQAVKYPEMQQKIHDELDALSTKVNVAEALLENTPYLEAFILESMRQLSAVILTRPHLVSEDKEVDGYLFPKGSIVLGDIFGMHHDEAVWDKPWTFDPERFLDKDGKILPRSDPIRKRVVHFSSGMRQCRGVDSAMEHIYGYLLGMICKYKVVQCSKSDLPSNDPMDYKTEVVPVIPEFRCIFEKK